ncbi:MAG: helix-turn-helix domain-containing protein [Fluviibacter sp.]|jgi:Fis family transcriptional regulator
MSTQHPSPLTLAVTTALEKYFTELAGEPATDVYEMVISCVERPMLQVVMAQASNNQTVAAQMLGINRNTLRKKLADHGLL